MSGEKFLAAQGKRSGMLGVMALIALLLVVAYFGGGLTHIGAVSIQAARVSLEEEPLLVSSIVDDPPKGDAEAPTEAPQVTLSAEGFDSFRGTIEQARSTARELLDEVILSASASAETANAALLQKTELARAVEMEASTEALLAVRGFEEAICSVQKGSVSVIVRADSLTQQQAAQILDIAMSVTGEPAANVRIVPSK